MSKSEVDPIDEKPLTMMKFGKLEDHDRSFDIEFWQKQTTEARFDAGWQMVVEYLISQGREDELEFQRSVAAFHRTRS